MVHTLQQSASLQHRQISKSAATLKLRFFIITLLSIAYFTLPWLLRSEWFNLIVKVRMAITEGDSGTLLLASGFSSIFLTLQHIILYLVLMLGAKLLGLSGRVSALLQGGAFIAITLLAQVIHHLPFEAFTASMALCVLFFISESPDAKHYLVKNCLIAVQVLFAFQWLNIMPALSLYGFGRGDVSVSIKLTSEYLNSTSLLNMMGGFFFFPLMVASILTYVFFQIHHKNMEILKQNHQQEQTLRDIRASAMENRIYQEINALAHDLKTPLVTIRGLNSLLALSKDTAKIEQYTDRIEGATHKMSEMISSFLYGSSRQMLDPAELIQYIQAQIPHEDEHLEVNILIDDSLPKILINKVRVVRALINLVENAIVVNSNDEIKQIDIHAFRSDEWVMITVSDNGIGIPEEQLDDIWVIGHSSNNTTGMGLPFAKQIIEENNGVILLESKVDVGTTVYVKFPIETGGNGK